ncbi:unnamed protein product [marine sediment metagenome]|uniref:Uncharacterized protein n=1 Tax=marine sediment metagenome TaxID=412755 RepID=X1TWL3_9ZZZZ
MHNLIYLGNDQYRCKDCGKGCDRAGVYDFQATDCEAMADLVVMNEKLTRLEKEMKEIETLYQRTLDRLANVEDVVNSAKNARLLDRPTG